MSVSFGEMFLAINLGTRFVGLSIFKRLTRKYFEFRFNNIDRHRHTRTRALTTRDA